MWAELNGPQAQIVFENMNGPLYNERQAQISQKILNGLQAHIIF